MKKVLMDDVWFCVQFQCPLCGQIQDLDCEDFYSKEFEVRCENCEEELIVPYPY